MFDRTIVLLVTAVLVIAPSTGMTAVDNPTDRDLERVNERLKGKIVSILLTDGSTIDKVEKVVVESNFTYWMEKGEEQKVATEQVLRIEARSKPKTGLAMGLGAATFALIVLAQNSSSTGDSTGEALEASGAVILGGVGALVGYGVSKAIPRKWHVVYEVPRQTPADPTADQAIEVVP